ncbi:MAG: LPS export ABC transporter periplasmic protein LptC [Flavobacteriales bacterium]
MRKNLHIPSLLFYLVFAITGLSCKNEIAEIRALTDTNRLPVQSSYNAEYILTEKGLVKNKLIATQLDQYQGEEDYIEATGGFTMIFYDSLQQEEARLNAVKGKYDTKQKRLIAWENVELFNVKGDKLETEELIYDQDSSLIYTQKFVSIMMQDDTLHGMGLESNDSFTKYKILKPYGKFQLNENTNQSNVSDK